MKKLFVLLIFASAFTIFANAQAKEGKINFDEKERPAVIGEFSYPRDIIELVVFDGRNLPVAYSKDLYAIPLYHPTRGFIYIYKKAVIPNITSDYKKYDFYVKVEEKKEDKNITILTFMIRKGNGKFVDGSNDPNIISKAINVMNELLPKFEEKKIELKNSVK